MLFKMFFREYRSVGGGFIFKIARMHSGVLKTHFLSLFQTFFKWQMRSLNVLVKIYASFSFSTQIFK